MLIHLNIELIDKNTTSLLNLFEIQLKYIICKSMSKFGAAYWSWRDGSNHLINKLATNVTGNESYLTIVTQVNFLILILSYCVRINLWLVLSSVYEHKPSSAVFLFSKEITVNLKTGLFKYYKL